MTYNADLQTKNARIQALIDRANALPDAGGGGAPEDLSAVLAEQEQLIATLQETLRGKTAGEGGSTDTRFYDLVQGVLAEVDDDVLTHVKQYAFAYDDTLRFARLPNVISIDGNSFRGCSNLESVDLPKVTGSLGAYTFQNCSKLKSVNVPLATNSSTALFQNCVELERVEFGNMATIGTSSFAGCAKLATLIIRGGRSGGTAPPNLSNVNAFSGTPIAEGTGYVYVKAYMLDMLYTGTNWSTYATQFRAIEDYPEICGG